MRPEVCLVLDLNQASAGQFGDRLSAPARARAAQRTPKGGRLVWVELSFRARWRSFLGKGRRRTGASGLRLRVEQRQHVSRSTRRKNTPCQGFQPNKR